MDLVVTVQGRTRESVQAELARMCRELGYEPMAGGRVMEIPGRGGRWMARAMPPVTGQQQVS